MNANHKAVAAVIVACSGVAALALRAPPASGVDRESAAVAREHDAALHERYLAHLAANNAAAERWKSTHRNDTPGRSTDDELVATNFGCPEGTRFWQRDQLTAMCATQCTSDADCAPEEGRCRVIDVFDEAKVPAAPLVDDTAPAEIEALVTDASRPEPPMVVCDPFWDLVDVPDLELFAVDASDG